MFCFWPWKFPSAHVSLVTQMRIVHLVEANKILGVVAIQGQTTKGESQPYLQLRVPLRPDLLGCHLLEHDSSYLF